MPKLAFHTILQGLAIGLYYAYFLVSVSGGVRAWFSSDDFMNLHYYWSRPWPRLVLANLAFFTDYYRPTGGAYYLGLFSLFGFDPLPFRIGALVVLSGNLILLCRFTALLTRSMTGGLLALLLTGMHASFFSLYFDTGMIYDALAYTFYYGALLYYLSLRSSGRLPTRAQTVVILALFVVSINAKEIAVTFPLAVGLYELLWAPPSSWRPRAVLLWLTLAPARLSLLSAALLMVYLAGKFLGAESLLANPSYRPQLSLAMYLDTYARYMAQLLYLVVPPSRITMFSILAAALGIAALSRRRELLWAAVFNVISVLPIAFIEARNGFAFYIPATGWTLYVVALLLYASDALTGRLSRVMSAPRASILQASRAALVVILAVYLLPLHSAMLQHPINFMRAARGYKPYWQQLRDLMPHPRPGGRILILNDPLPADTYEMYFLVRLMFADRSLIVHRVKQTPKTVSSLDPSEYDYVIDFVGDRFVLAESRHRPGKPRLRCRGSGHDRILT